MAKKSAESALIGTGTQRAFPLNPSIYHLTLVTVYETPGSYLYCQREHENP